VSLPRSPSRCCRLAAYAEQLAEAGKAPPVGDVVHDARAERARRDRGDPAASPPDAVTDPQLSSARSDTPVENLHRVTQSQY